jgi:hypothetical protein
MDKVKLCKDCRYLSNYVYAICEHPESVQPIVDLIAGDQYFQNAQYMRLTKCGVDAVLFEPKKKKWWLLWIK